MTTLFIIKFSSGRIKSGGGVWRFEIFAPTQGPMLTKTKKKKIRKNLKIEKRQKNGLEILWRGSYPQTLAWIHMAVSEKLEVTDDGRTTAP